MPRLGGVSVVKSHSFYQAIPNPTVSGFRRLPFPSEPAPLATVRLRFPTMFGNMDATLAPEQVRQGIESDKNRQENLLTRIKGYGHISRPWIRGVILWTRMYTPGRRSSSPGPIFAVPLPATARTSRFGQEKGTSDKKAIVSRCHCTMPGELHIPLRAFLMAYPLATRLKTLKVNFPVP